MNSDKRISLTKRIISLSTLAIILPLASISFGDSPACPFSSSTQWDKKSTMRSRNLKIVASIKKGETKQSLILEIALKNISPKEISFRDTNVLFDYSFVVKDGEGKVLSPSAGGEKRMLESGMISYKPALVLKPQEQLTRQLVITEIYNFRPREVYTITVYRRLSLDEGKTVEEARSNIIKAKVDG